MKEQPLVSVIVPVYNVEKYLKRCLDSVLAQSYKNLEIILVDDGSTDRSGEICDEYKKKDGRIRVIHKENGGLSDARNEGMKIGKGDYACFVDSDDVVKNDYVEYLFGLIKKFDVEMSVAKYEVVTGSGKRIVPGGEIYSEVFSEKVALEELLSEKHFTVSANAKMYAKRLYKKIIFPKGKLCEDNGTTYKFIMMCKSIAFGNKIVYSYYKNSGSIMMGAFSVRRFDLVELTDEMCKAVVSKYKDLKEIALRRMILARFSIIRQVNYKELARSEKGKVDSYRGFILQNKRAVLFNSVYSLRDKIALISLMFGYRVFSLVWNVYSNRKYA